MSMLSAQCDKLRERAATLRQGRWSDGADDARLMEDAAETILSLRDRAQDLQAENAKLREERDKMDVWHSKELSATMAENAKLRGLAERAWNTAERLCQAFDGPCRDDGVTAYEPCPMGERDEECVYGQLQRELRECGVEVDA